jgi:hypothetical protein
MRLEGLGQMKNPMTSRQGVVLINFYLYLMVSEIYFMAILDKPLEAFSYFS